MLIPWKESYGQPRQHMEKQRHYYATKVHLVKATVFHVWMWELEHRRIDAFELWCWRRLLRISWTVMRPNQSILKEINPGIFLEGMMLKLKLQYFGHLMRRVDHWKRLWCWEGLGAAEKGMTEDEIAEWHHLLNGCESEWTPGAGGGQGGLACCN